MLTSLPPHKKENNSNAMSVISSSTDLKISNDKDISNIFNKASSNGSTNYQSDFINIEKNIPNIFTTPELNQSDCKLYPLSVVEREKAIPNIFNVDKFQKHSTFSSKYADNFFEYPDLFTLQKQHLESYNDFPEKYSNYTDVFSSLDVDHIGNVQHLEVNNRNNVKQEKDNLLLNDKLLNESSSSEDVFIDSDISNEDEKCFTSEQNLKENMSTALCFWCIVTGANVRDYNIKTYFPRREISFKCIMKDIKLMLIDMGTKYFLFDEESQMYKKNGNISISGLTPDMFESASESILECSNLYKTICSTITKWKETSDNNIIKAFIFAVSNILHDYERTIYAVSNESFLSLICRLFHIIPQLQLLADICCIKIQDNIAISDHVPCSIKLLNKVHNYLIDYRFPHNSFLKMLLYIFESCSLAYFRILSNWALKGILNDSETDVFIKLRSDILDEDSSRKSWDYYIIDESIEIPIFLENYKKDILNCGKTINFFNKYNNLNEFVPDFACCFDVDDTQKVYKKFSNYFKYHSGLKTPNCVKSMSNCYLFESVVGPDHQQNNTDCNNIQNENVTYVTKPSKIDLNNESYEFFQIPDWTLNDNTYDFNKPYGFFTDNDDVLMYNGKPFDVFNMIDYIPHSLLIPARIQKSVCDKHILDMYFIQENLMGRLYYLSQCFFLMNWQFSSKLSEALFDGIITNRHKPDNIFNPVKLKSIVDEAVQDSFSGNEPHNLSLSTSFIPHLNGIIDISDVECLDLNYFPEWPMNMILPNKILLKYKRTFLFANKLEYVSWSLFKARELLNEHKNESGLQFRMINLFKHWMNQFVTSIKQYYKQVVIGTCWSELNESFENIQNYDDLYASHKQYMHTMLKRCLMVVGLKSKLILLNKIYIEILNYYQALASGQFYMENSVFLHSKFVDMEQCFSRFVKLREMFYLSLLETIQTQEKHYVVQLESLVTILGPSYNF